MRPGGFTASFGFVQQSRLIDELLHP
jgi:hypothetical protein